MGFARESLLGSVLEELVAERLVEEALAASRARPAAIRGPMGMKKINCGADYGKKVGDDVCCGQAGKVDKMEYVCPAHQPKCTGLISGKRWGTCVRSPTPGKNPVKNLPNSQNSNNSGGFLGKFFGGMKNVIDRMDNGGGMDFNKPDAPAPPTNTGNDIPDWANFHMSQ